MRLACVVLAMLVGNASCGSPNDPTPVAAGEPFELRPGGVATLDDGALRVTFERLVNDSRCPQGVTCIWEGDAVVELQLAERGADPSMVQLHTAGSLGNETNHAGYRVRLSGVTPYPREGVSIRPEDYRVTLVVYPITR